MKKIELVIHFAKDDKDYSYDYCSVDVKIGGKIVRHYSDAYHDKGDEKAHSFIDGYLFALGKDINIERPSDLYKEINKADDIT